MSRVHRLLIVLGGACLSACTVGPDYQTPDVLVPTAFGGGRAVSGAAAGTQAAPDIARWWGILHDRELNALIERAVTAGPDVEIALTRLQAARVQETAVAGLALPRVNVSAGAAAGTGT